MESYAQMMQEDGGAGGMGALSEMMGGALDAPMEGGPGADDSKPGPLPQAEMQTMIDVLKEVRTWKMLSALKYPSLFVLSSAPSEHLSSSLSTFQPLTPLLTFFLCSFFPQMPPLLA